MTQPLSAPGSSTPPRTAPDERALILSPNGDPRYHAFIQTTLDAICIYDAETKRILEANPAFLELLGYTQEEAQQLSIASIVAEERVSVTGYFQEIIVAGRGSRTERCWRHKNGSLIDVQVTASPIREGGQEFVFVVARDMTERRQAEQRFHELYQQLQNSHARLTDAYEATLEGLAIALELRDKETRGHTRRVTQLTVRLAQAMGVPEEDIVHIRRGALLHDIGKIGIPDGILLKPGALTVEEQMIMARHPTYAYEMVTAIPFLHPAIDIPYCHHEKWDGTGYPRGLSDEAIPLAARIFAVVDVWDALSTDRPYRKSWPREKIIAHIKEMSGTHFDPAVVTTFLKLVIDSTHPLD
jgi:PAS domain S-box-containing protein/putative nucleotidyltransferase with HDIG domain